MTQTKNRPVDEFLAYECGRDGQSVSGFDGYKEAWNFLSVTNPNHVEGIELEYTLMHLAYIVDPENEFKDNRNIPKPRLDKFMDHVELMHTSDLVSWSRQLYNLSLWPKANLRIANLVYNWLNNSLDRPESLL
jgi:hypothetical protein